MTIPFFGKFKLFCIFATLALGACGGGGSSSLAPTPVPEVVVPPVPDNKSVLTLQLLDTDSQAAGTGPLKTNQFDSFSFFLNDKLIFVRSPAINTAKTFADLRSAIDSAITALKATNPALANLSVTLGPNYTVFDVRSQTPVVGQSILLTDTGGAILLGNPFTSWSTVGGIAFPGTIHNRIIGVIPVSK